MNKTHDWDEKVCLNELECLRMAHRHSRFCVFMMGIIVGTCSLSAVSSAEKCNHGQSWVQAMSTFNLRFDSTVIYQLHHTLNVFRKIGFAEKGQNKYQFIPTRPVSMAKSHQKSSEKPNDNHGFTRKRQNVHPKNHQKVTKEKPNKVLHTSSLFCFCRFTN